MGLAHTMNFQGGSLANTAEWREPNFTPHAARTKRVRVQGVKPSIIWFQQEIYVITWGIPCMKVLITPIDDYSGKEVPLRGRRHLAESRKFFCAFLLSCFSIDYDLISLLDCHINQLLDTIIYNNNIFLKSRQ